MKKITIELHGVAKTLLLPLQGRALHSKHANPYLIDPEAIRISEALDFDYNSLLNFHFKTLDKNSYHTMMLFWPIRAMRLDNIIQEYLKHHPQATIVNLGAGLETAFYRNDNGLLNWVDLDLPEVIAIREQLFEPHKRIKTIAKSILDFSWLDDIPTTEHGVLFIAAGLFMYFQPEDVKKIFCKIADRFSNAEIAFDVLSELGVKRGNEMLSKVSMNKAILHWGIKTPNIIADWHPKLHLIENIPYFKGIKRNHWSDLEIFLTMFFMDKLKSIAIYHFRINENDPG